MIKNNNVKSNCELFCKKMLKLDEMESRKAFFESVELSMKESMSTLNDMSEINGWNGKIDHSSRKLITIDEMFKTQNELTC